MRTRLSRSHLTSRPHSSQALSVLVNFSKMWYRKRDMIEGLCAAKIKHVYDARMMRVLPGTDVDG
jgi:hypothetical protein